MLCIKGSNRLTHIAAHFLTFFLILDVIFINITSVNAASWGKQYIPNITVTSHEGKSYQFYDDLIKDKLVLINFMYTRCTDICPLQSARLNKLQKKMGDRLGKDIFIYSISMDPGNDSVAALKQQAEGFKAKPGWLFLTGDTQQLSLLRYKLGERSRRLTEHQNGILLGNGATGKWRRDSLLQEPARLLDNLYRMEPAYMAKVGASQTTLSQQNTLTEHTRALSAVTPAANANSGKQPIHSNRALASQRATRLKANAGQALFIKSCGNCHTLGGGNDIGPDLANVHVRRNAEWLVRYVMDPEGMLDRKDPVALALDAEYPDVVMPVLSLSQTDVADVLNYIRVHSPKADGASRTKTTKTTTNEFKTANKNH